jgi:uncharacterized protein YjbI with pentapeptide repeats
MGLNLRGADLRQINLRRLPLAFMPGGLFLDAWLRATEEQRNMAAVQLQGARLREAQLQGVDLRRSDLDGATLERVTLSDEAYGSVRLPDLSGERSISRSLIGSM